MAKLENDFLASLENKFKEDQPFHDSEWDELIQKIEDLPIVIECRT